jgi:hypothetical protein
VFEEVALLSMFLVRTVGCTRSRRTGIQLPRLSGIWITSGLSVIQEERLTNLNEPSLNSYLNC